MTQPDKPASKTVPPSKGGTTGFRRLQYPNALDPADLRALLDPMRLEGRPNHRLSNYQTEALATLDRTASTLFRLEPDDITTDDLAVEFILGLDKTDPQARLRAIVSRAYWVADAYAREYARRLDDEEEAAEYDKIHAAAMKLFAGESGSVFDKGKPWRGLARDALAARAIERAERFRTESDEAAADRRERVAAAFATLEELNSINHHIAESARDGRPPDAGRLFFILRLAEAFAVWAGREPDYYDGLARSRAKPGARMRAPEWNDFVRSALILTGLGDQGLDNALKRLLGNKPGSHEDGSAWIPHHLEALATYSSDQQLRELTLHISHFHSINWLDHVKLTFNPTTYEPLPPVMHWAENPRWFDPVGYPEDI